METKELKVYLKHVLDLESAIYQTQQIKAEYTNRRTAMKPQEITTTLPTKPIEPQLLSENVSWYDTFDEMNPFPKVIWIFSAMIAFFCVFFPIAFGLAEGWFDLLTSMLIVGIVATIFCVCIYINTHEDILQNRIQTNMNRKERYKTELQTYNDNYAAIQEMNSTARQTYSQDIERFNQETHSTLQKIAQTDIALKNTLHILYSKNIVYAKYRNLVAIATLYEYIDSGRCFDLEGPNGAYNLYEGELRSDIIIASLNSILANLETIKHNQYALYQCIENANTTTQNLLLNINNTQKLTAYFAQQSAIAASADRYITGIIF